MAINSLSSSGQYINIDALVQNAVNVQQQRLTNLKTEKTTADTQISTLGKVKSQLASLEDKFKAINTSFNNYNITGTPEGMTVNAKDKGVYAVAVDSLASEQIVASKNPSAKGALGYSGTLSINTGSYDGSNTFNKVTEGTEISVSDTDTLQDIAKKINDSNSGVSAVIINGSDGQHLSLSGNNMGEQGAFEITTKDTNNTGLSALNYNKSAASNYNNVSEAQDGRATVNGLSIKSADNNFVVSDSFSFAANKTSEQKTINIKRDDTAVSKAINEFTTAYNATNSSMKTMDVDNQLKGFTSKIRDTLGRVDYSSSVSNLGLSFDKNGTLSFDNTKFTAYMSNTKNDAKALLNSQFSATSAVVGLFDRATDTGGSIDNQVNSLTEKNRKLATSISTSQDVLLAQTKNYQAQFAKIDQYLSQLNDNSNSVTQLLAQFNSNK